MSSMSDGYDLSDRPGYRPRDSFSYRSTVASDNSVRRSFAEELEASAAQLEVTCALGATFQWPSKHASTRA